MINKKGAMTLAEGSPDLAYKTDASIIFNTSRTHRDFVLRTCYDSLEVWKTKHGVPVSAFKMKSIPSKYCAEIDRELWVFSIDGTNSSDIYAAVRAGMAYYKVSAQEIISDIYVKNLNAEHENEMTFKSLVNANKDLYSKVCVAIIQAAKQLGIKNSLNFYVFSNSKNSKIPKEDLHNALKSGGALDVKTDDTRIKQQSQSNDALRTTLPNAITHLHWAKLKI
ncbi:hypothetical protein TDB9533_03696 [Thalassocella blandensis]|nr:hypothetical protein TDB9533_03696 [Thalassocella blandensis]